MRYRFISLIFFLGVCLMTACSSGVYVQMDSTAPEHGPVFIGMKRYEAERHLGTPLFVTRINEDQYKGIYAYEEGLTAADKTCIDLMDFTTMGLGNLLVPPIDRLKGMRHLMAVVYQMDDKEVCNDRIIGIKERINVKGDVR